MSRYLSRVAEILDLANSKKLLERKNFLVHLQAIYQDDEFIEAINEHTSNDFKSSTSWNQIMIAIHHVILMEAEKPASKSSKANTAMIFQSGCCSLMLKTISLATATRQMFLNCTDLMAIIFQILERNIYEFYHDTYINILVNYVLPNKMYRLEISLEQWRQILRLSLGMYKHKQSLTKSLLLDTVRIATHYGCLQSHLQLDIKAMLLFLEKVFQDIALGKEMMMKPVYKLTYTVCQQIAIEKRSTLCEFGEKILPSIINLEGCSQKYNLLLVLVQIHHPGGASPDNDAACAHDWEQWKNMIRGIYASVVRDIKTEKLSTSLLKLACEVHRQIMLDPTHIADETPSCSYSGSTQPRKRPRLSLAARKPIDMLMDNDIEITWPLIQILTVLLKKYPNSLQSSDYVAFLKTVTEFFTTSLKNETIMDSLCELCTVLVKAEKKHFPENEQNETVIRCWEKIWDTILRASSMNQNERLGHELLQSIIEERGALNPNNFLRLYLTDAIRCSFSSVKTLLTFCDNTAMPDELSNNTPTSSKPEIPPRISLLRWCLGIPSSKLSSHASIVQLSNLLTALTLRSWHKREFRELRNSHERANQQKILVRESLERELFNDRESRTFNDIEHCYLAVKFQKNLFDKVEEETVTKNNETNLRIIYVQESLDFLVTALDDFIGDRVNETDCSDIVTKLSVIASLLSNFAELHISADSQISKIVTLFAETFNKISGLLVTMENTRSVHLVHTIEALEILYSIRYQAEVSNILVKLSSMNFLEFIYNLLYEDDTYDEPIVDDENSQNFNIHGKRPRQSTEKLTKIRKELTDACRINNAAHNILTYFCCAWTGEEMSEAQKKVMKNLMKIDLYGSMSNANLRRALRILKIYGTSEQLNTSQETQEMANNFLGQLFDSRIKDETAVRGVLNVLPHFFQASLQRHCETQTLSEILRTMNKCLAKKSYGPLVYADFVNCLARIIRTNPQVTWNSNEADETYPIIDILVSHINNPFYAVRLEVVRALHVIFSSSHLDVPSKLKFFGKIESVIADLLVFEEISNESEKEDDRSTRISTVLHIYGAIIHADEFLRSRALYSIVKLSALKNVKTSMLKKALLSVTKNQNDQRCLVELNLYYLLSRWFEDGYPLQLFPWILVDCDSQEDFSRRHIETLIMIKLQRREFQHLTILCSNLEVSYGKTIENSFSSIMGLLISMIVGDSSDNNEFAKYATEMYEKLRSNSEEFEDVKSFNDLLEEKLSEIIVNIIKRLRDEEHFYKIFQRRVFLPTLNPPNFNISTVARCLHFLETVLPTGNKHLIEYLVVTFPHVLQRVTLTLICNIHDANCTAQKLQTFHQYAYFVTEIVLELQKSHFDPMALYIVRDVTHSLLALIKQEAEPLSEMACEYFHVFLSGSLPARSAEIKEILSFTVSTLIPIIQSSKVKGAMKILRSLIIDQRQLLGDAIKKLDTFPNEESFEEIKQIHNSLKYTTNKNHSLEKEIEHFLNAINEKTLSCSHEGLVHVENQLSTRKRELRMMYGRLESMRGFAEDCASSTLHKLVYKLVQLTRSSDSVISLEAAKCLGEIGPADLTTTILHAENGYAKEDSDQIAMLTLRVINQLADYLIENNMNLRRASSNALYEIFSTNWGHDLMNESLIKDLMLIHKIDNPKLYDYIYPFGKKIISSTCQRTLYVDRGNWQRCIDLNNDLWRPASYDSYSKWIIEITNKLLDCFVNLYTTSLKPVCCESVEFCEILLPRLVNLIKQTDDHLVNDVCICINRFFAHLYEFIRDTDLTIMTPDHSTKGEIARSYECVRCMINVVNFMRIQSSDNAPMPLDYLYIAKAAQYCSAYFTSVLYAELWCETVLQDSGLLQDKIPGSWISAIDSICELKPEPGKLLQDIVREAYLHIGDPDSIYGCGMSHLINSSFRTQHYIHLRQWDKVLVAQDVELNSGNPSFRGILHTLHQSGLESLLGRVLNTINPEIDNLDDFMYESAWRLGNWSLPEADCINKNSENSSILQNLNNSIYHALHYRALKCLCDNDLAGLKNSLDNARSSIVNSLGKTSLECSRTVYPILSQLQMLREIEEFATRDSESNEELIKMWQEENFIDTHDFQYIEPILSQRLVIYRTKNCTGQMDDLSKNAFVKTHLDIAEVAEKQGYLPIAARSLHSLEKMQNLSSIAKDQLAYREAFLAWKRNDQDIGRYLLRNLIKKPSLNANLRAKALRVYGNWMAETKSENPQSVIENYYEESIKTSCGIEEKNDQDVKNLTDAQADLAQFADAQYQHIMEFMKSPQYESLVECSKLQQDDKNSRSSSAKGKDEIRAMITYERQVTNDAAELEDIKREKEMYLILATRYYLMTLQNSDDNDLLIFRLVSLWLDNTLNKELNKLLYEKLGNVASHKFIILLPQLAPHMSNERNIFTRQINDLMERCAKEHPHHTLPVLLALKNTYKDHEFKPPEKGSQRRDKLKAEPRVVAAAGLIAKLVDSPIRPIIREMSDLSHALVSLAYFAVTESQARKKDPIHNIPRNQPIMKIRNYTNICVSTITLDVRPHGNYEDIVGIMEYEPNFELPGGVNAPKKVICIGTDGVRRKQLIKGQDDLRQDAVMQQVCTVMNSMLRASKETKRRKLHIRTYKIVPLSQRSGILEWCENTLPISNVLCDTENNPGMHTKYYPNDWSVTTCRKKLYAVDKSSVEVKLKVFLECCKNLHPAFHHFFMEKYPSAETWFERRLAYVRSVATTSMVGYMLGLGDRHFSNILIDQTTAEVIHIDFGIAFAQGKVLPIPETVPFRLTRDMEVAMGICGVEGVMRRSCEETITVLRDQRKILITLLQVLLYDPLFSWAITPVKTDDHESNPSRHSTGRLTDDRGMKKTNKIAERALLRIEQKLQGTEDGIGSSISGQVERLIQQARDPANLCRLYSGWQAYL